MARRSPLDPDWVESECDAWNRDEPLEDDVSRETVSRNPQVTWNGPQSITGISGDEVTCAQTR